MSAGADALSVARLLADGRPRTHSELIIATGIGGDRIRKAIAVAVSDGLISSLGVLVALGSAKGRTTRPSPMARNAKGLAYVQCWQSTGKQP
jgi:hypothetical protein